jgi:N-acetylglucosaminyldiphosphoundecaprenol N-acetyl-beta-D-mannosaminyltransferase
VETIREKPGSVLVLDGSYAFPSPFPTLPGTVRVSTVRLAEATTPEVRRLIREAVSVRARPTVQISTVNLDHLALARRDAGFRAVLRRSTVCLADGVGPILLGRLQGRRIPERVAGADVTAWLVDGGLPGIRLFLLGGTPGVVERVAERATAAGAMVAGSATPPRQAFEHPRSSSRLVQEVNAANPDVLLVALGAPLQETWIQRWAWNLDVSVAIGVGGSLDFMGGRQQRAPRAFQRIGCEWLYRLASDPVRLWRRYVGRDLPFLATESVRVVAARLLPRRHRAAA